MNKAFASITDLDLNLVTGGTQIPAACKGMTKFYNYAVAHPDQHPSPAAFCRMARSQMNAPASSDGAEGGI